MKIRQHLKKWREAFKLEKAKLGREKLAIEEEESRDICIQKIPENCNFFLFLRIISPNCFLYVVYTVIFLFHIKKRKHAIP